MLAFRVGVHGGDGQGGLALLQAGHDAVLEGSDGGIRDLRGVLVGLAQLDLDLDLSGIALEENDVGGLNAQGQVGGGLILVQTGDGPDRLVEVADLAVAGGIVGIDGVQVSQIANAVVVGQIQEVVLRIVDHGGPDLVGGVGHAGQIDAGLAELIPGQVAVVAHGEQEQLAALGHDVERGSVVVAIVGGTAGEGDGGHGIGAEVVVRQIEVDQAAGLGIEHGQVGTVVVGSDDGADVVAHVSEGVAHILRQRFRVGGDPHGDDAAVGLDLVGIGVEAKHGVVGGAVNLVADSGAPAELADNSQSFPIVGGVGAEDGGLALAVLVPDDAANLRSGRLGHVDGDVLGQVRLSHGGHGDGGAAHGDAGDNAVLHGGDGLVVGLHGDVLVGQGPGHDVGLDGLAALADQQVDLLGLNDQIGSLVGGRDDGAGAGDDDQAADVGVQTAGDVGVAAAGADGVGTVGHAGLGVDDPQVVVVVAGGVVVGDGVEDTLVVVPGEAAAVAVVVEAQVSGADGSGGDDALVLRLDGLVADLVAQDLHSVNVEIVLVSAAVVTDGNVDLFLAQVVGKVNLHVGPVDSRRGLGKDLDHFVRILGGADVDVIVLRPRRGALSDPEGELRVLVLGQVDGRGDRPVVHVGVGAPAGADAAGAFLGGAGAVDEGVAVAVPVKHGPVIQLSRGVEEPGVAVVDNLNHLQIVQRELVELGSGGAAVVRGVEVAVVVDGKGVEIGGSGIRRGQSGVLGQRAGDQIHGVQLVVVAQDVELLVTVVEGHVKDGANRVAVLADHHDLVHGVDVGHVEVAVVAGHEDVAVHVLSGGHSHVDVGKQTNAGQAAAGGIAADLVGVDLPDTVAAAHAGGAARADKAEHGAAELVAAVVAAAQVNLEGDLVAGVVAHEQGDFLGQGDALEVQRNLKLLAGLGLLGNGLEVDLVAGLVHDRDVSHVLVIVALDVDVAGDEVLQRADHNGIGVVDGDVILDAGALADQAGLQHGLEAFAVQTAGGGDFAVHLGVHHAVVLGQGVEADGDLVAFRHAGGGQLLAHVEAAGVVLLPDGAVHVVVGREELTRGSLSQEHLAVLVQNREAHGSSVADVDVVVGLNGVVAVHGQLLSGELVLDDVGVAHVGAGLTVFVLQGQVVGVGVGQVGQLAGAIGLVDDGGAIQHGGIGPAAAEAVDGDGVHDVHRAFSGGHGLDVGVAFHIEALGEVAQQEVLVALVDLDVDGNLGGLVDDDGLGTAVVKDQLGVEGGDGAVAVHVSDLGVEGSAFDLFAGDVVQDGLGVGLVGHAVHVNVGLDRKGLLDGLAVDLIGGLGSQEDGALILEHAVTAVAGQPLGEDVGA